VPSDIPVGNPYVPLAWDDAQHVGLDPQMFVRQINQESGFNPNALSHTGAQGIAQLTPDQAHQLNLDPWEPRGALQGAARLMAHYQQRYGGDVAEALAAYDAGPDELDRALKRCGSGWQRCLSDETQLYIQVILNG
jgi:soluble lytic murein transglycosylase-like protein